LITVVVVRHRSWLWLEVLLAVVSLTAAAVVVARRGPSEVDLLRTLSRDIVRVLETASPAQHHDHGHTDVVAGDKVVCEAEAFGHDPASVHSAAEVRWAYAYYLCAAAPPGTPWDEAARISGPVAVSPADGVVRIAEAGLGYQDRVRALIPARYADRAGGFADPAIPARLRGRYEAEIARR
jgi:hypothetical protein